MNCCIDCGFIFNDAFDETLLDYGQQYDNTQTFSPSFNDYTDDLVKHLVEECDVRNCNVVEVGCGKGSFLRKLVEYPASGLTGVGFDPTYIGLERDLDRRLEFRKVFFDERSANLAADVVICRHVIEHVSQPVRFLRTIRSAIRTTDHARVFFETPCVEWILKNGVIWDFFYEHCSLFSETSLATAFQVSGFRVNSIRRVFGGQYLWIDASAAERIAPPLSPGQMPQLAQHFATVEQVRQRGWIARINALAEKGPVAIWGAGAKGVTFANLIDPDHRTIVAVVDVNPMKQGKFLAGTGHPIIAPDELPRRLIRSVLVLNPNYITEIRRTANYTSWEVEIVNLMDDTST